MSDDADDHKPARKPLRLSDLKLAPGVETAVAAVQASEKIAASIALNERISRLTDTARLGSINAVADQLAKQQKLIDAFARPKHLDAIEAATRLAKMPDYMAREMPSIPEIHIPPNPIHETNRRLATIEERFDKMQEIAGQGAEIATSLQVSAAEFLTKFDEVATKNDRTAGRAVGIALIAIVMSVAVPSAQMLYTETWKASNDAAAMQKIVSDLKSEIGTLRDAQRQSAERLGEVIGNSNSDIATTLREVRDNLAKANAKLASETAVSKDNP